MGYLTFVSEKESCYMFIRKVSRLHTSGTNFISPFELQTYLA